MTDVILEALEHLEYPLIILDKDTREVVYTNSKGKILLEELERRNICLKLDPLEEKNIVLSLEKPFPQVFFGKCKLISEDLLLLTFQEIRKEKPFSGFLFELIEELPVIVFFIKEGRIIYVNKCAEEILGCSRDELYGKRIIEDLVWELDRPKAMSHCKRVMSGIKDFGVIFALERKDGRIKNFLWNCFMTSDWEGDPVIIAIATDITEYLELSRKIENLHKTQTFSEFLRGLVHDFNNVLQAIHTHLQRLRTAPLSQLEEIVSAIEGSINSWIDINRILLDYTRESKDLRQKKIDLIKFLKENLEVFQFILGEKIKLYLDLGFYKKLYVYGDQAFWRYIFLNFLTNAKDAMEGEGEVYISLSVYEDVKTAKKYVKIDIKDTGCGIPEEMLPKIFEPFFTTKEKGSGLGLFLVNHHIKNLEGFIEVESKPGKGTVFSIYVPLCEEKSICSKKEESEISLENKVVWIIEDDEDILSVLKEVLEGQKMKVYTFKEGKDLLEKIDGLENPELVLVDFNLPDIEGRELVRILKERKPFLKFLYLTGDIFALAEVPEEKLILKPFKIEELLEKIKKALGTG